MVDLPAEGSDLHGHLGLPRPQRLVVASRLFGPNLCLVEKLARGVAFPLQVDPSLFQAGTRLRHGGVPKALHEGGEASLERWREFAQLQARIVVLRGLPCDKVVVDRPFGAADPSRPEVIKHALLRHPLARCADALGCLPNLLPCWHPDLRRSGGMMVGPRLRQRQCREGKREALPTSFAWTQRDCVVRDG
jgi:hypothetical protein